MAILAFALVLGALHVHRTSGRFQNWSAAQGRSTWHGQPQSEVWRPWRRIDEVADESSLSVRAFEENYMQRHTPLLFRGWATADKRPALARWTLKRLRDRCGGATVRFSDRHLAFLSTVNATERRSIERRLLETDGVTLAEVLARGAELLLGVPAA